MPRRWDIGNLTKFVILIGPMSSIFDYATYFTSSMYSTAGTMRRCFRPAGSSNHR